MVLRTRCRMSQLFAWGHDHSSVGLPVFFTVCKTLSWLALPCTTTFCEGMSTSTDCTPVPGGTLCHGCCLSLVQQSLPGLLAHELSRIADRVWHTLSATYRLACPVPSAQLPHTPRRSCPPSTPPATRRCFGAESSGLESMTFSCSGFLTSGMLGRGRSRVSRLSRAQACPGRMSCLEHLESQRGPPSRLCKAEHECTAAQRCFVNN